MSDRDFDVIFAGGGLAATLAAYRLRQVKPELSVLVLEADEKFGGNHTWSFHTTDISEDAWAWIAPFVAHSWSEQQVRFPKHTRMLKSGYNSIFSETLHDAALPALKDSVRFSTRVLSVSPHQVVLSGGELLRARCVIDARGIGRVDNLTIGYQKFLGLVVRFERPHGQPYPIIMDATVRQRDGYRFVYTLPFTDDTMLIEDTYYSDNPAIDAHTHRELCLDYARERGWQIAEIEREERGVLPIVLGGDVSDILERNADGVPALGLRGGFFHHTTSYSFPFAVRCADAIASMDHLTSESLHRLTHKWAHQHWREQRFFRLLNRMLFWAAKPETRYRVLQRFYDLHEPLIERFYSSSLTLADQGRILIGWPPVPIHKAVRVMGETRVNPIPQPVSSPS
ncbi:lycopene cyclase [Rhodomicrobium udaipurense JA643]|uniref:Lycopene beta-cyclase CrtY n=1 Tax=Rhodomicrobium udaipurense TaxID=1202716 RepID=A0A8I1GH65_9HYPH|nr:lycopene beta-cyclase CrtY [Rhodomicrobium udaipurense]KAI94295.1 lycopene cyclase [Rhodomicrobium udaipurense JA643]MBJ7542902.1 lycopene beta-cyclase CrtY [Rhodomicrobium udaipurense]